MSVHDHMETTKFQLFLDETLHENACRAVEEYLRDHHETIDNTQLYSIQAIVQAAGLAGIKELSENQMKKNTNEKNKEFWTYINLLLFEPPSIPTPEFTLRTLVRKHLMDAGLLQNEPEGSDKIKQRQVRKQNREAVEVAMEAALATYFEHFNCHYFFKKG